MKVTGMNRTTEQRNLLRIYSIDKKEIITIIVEQGIKLIEKKIRIPENAPAIQTDEGALNQ